MALRANVIMLGVEDLDRSKTFYIDGLGGVVNQEFRGFLRFSLGEGSSEIALYGWNAVADDAGVAPEGSGFRGVSFHHLTDNREEVDEVMRAAEAAGGTIVKPAADAGWGYFGYFADPDGWLWKVAAS
jgi:predicted lactoylglutathione lyase